MLTMVMTFGSISTVLGAGSAETPNGVDITQGSSGGRDYQEEVHGYYPTWVNGGRVLKQPKAYQGIFAKGKTTKKGTAHGKAANGPNKIKYDLVG